MPGRRGRLLVPALALLTTVTSVVSSLGAPLVPAIAEDADVSIGAAQWSLTAALLVGAVSTPVVGRLGGNRRRKTVILGGLLIVTLGTLLSALPLGLPWLLAGRAMQGVGIGLTPLAMAVAREFVPPAKLPGTIALLSVTAVAGAGLGYPITAWTADAFGIAAAFWLGFGICSTTLVSTVVSVPPSASTAEDRVDWLGAVMLASCTAGVLLAVSQGDPWGWRSREVMALFLGGLAVLALWVRRTLRVDHPLVDLRMAYQGGAVAANTTAVSAGVAVYMLLSLVMLSVQAPRSTGFGLDESVTIAGLLLVPYSATTMLGSRLAVLLSRRILPDLILPLGSTVYLASTLALARWHYDQWQLLAVMGVAGLGSGLCFSVMPGLIVRSVPPAETGSATAFHHVLRFFGFSFGSALAMALLEAFSVDGKMVDRSFTSVTLVAAALWVVTIVLGLVLGLRQVGKADAGAVAVHVTHQRGPDARDCR